MSLSTQPKLTDKIQDFVAMAHVVFIVFTASYFIGGKAVGFDNVVSGRKVRGCFERGYIREVLRQ